MDTTDNLAYRDNQELLQALRQLGDTLIERALLLKQQAGEAAVAGSATEDKTAALYRQASQRPAAGSHVQQQIAQLDLALQQLWQSLDRRSAASVQAKVFLPWVHLALLFQLKRCDQALLLCTLLAEFDSRYQTILRALAPEPPAGDDSYTPLASAVLMLGGGPESRIEIQQSLMSDAALRQWDLVELAEGGRLGTLAGGYRINAAITAYLLARAAPQLRLEQALDELGDDLELADHLVDADVIQQLSNFVAHAATDEAPASSYLLHLQGPDLSLQQSLCAAAFRRLGMHCVKLDGKAIWQTYLNGQKNRHALLARLRLLCRDALLCNRVLVLSHCQWLSGQDSADDLLDEVCHTLLDSQRYLAVLNGPARRLNDLAHQYARHRAIPILIKSRAPSAALRQHIWQRHLPGSGFSPDETSLAQLVNQYPYTEEQIATVVKEAASLRVLNPHAETATGLLLDACREQSNKQQLSVAQEVKTAYRFDDIVLPANTRQWLLEVLQYAQNRHQVIENWGFDSKHPNSKNLCVLFYGPSGTGKTMAASIIANELNLGLYKIDLANIVSKYIGETEKHLAQLFDQAEAMNIVLFFDEAESLFSKRTETKDAHDRYANLQTGYLLQRIETYPGIVILSTNLLKNMDQAFTRRFKFMIEYPFPGASQRLQLWRNAFPAATPLADDLDFTLLAQKAALSGGNINNIAVSAAFLAAAERQSVSQRHVLQATEREYHKLGKVFDAGDFNWSEDD